VIYVRHGSPAALCLFTTGADPAWFSAAPGRALAVTPAERQLAGAAAQAGAGPAAGARSGATLKAMKIGGPTVLANAKEITLCWFAPLLDTYRQMAVRQQKKKDWRACLWRTERGLGP
jgi:hypothetical protein